jgi:hypothetical protein
MSCLIANKKYTRKLPIKMMGKSKAGFSIHILLKGATKQHTEMLTIKYLCLIKE